MSLVRAYLSAFRDRFTYDILHNPYVGFGVLWGLPIPVFSLFLHCHLVPGILLPECFRSEPLHFIFLLHPPLFAVVFGAMGTLRRELEIENRKLIERLQSLASTDALTGVYNRRRVLEELATLTKRAQRSGDPVSVILFDMDNFKAVNDLQGHLAGDRVLHDVATALRGEIRAGDFLGRYGGDEFLMVTPAGSDEAATLATRAAKACETKTGMTISWGVAESRVEGPKPEVLILAADRKLAEKKQARRDRGEASPR